MTTPRRRWTTALILAALTTTSLQGCASQNPGSITVLATWTGTEKAQFQKVLDAFRQKYGIQVKYLGTRSVSQTLAADLQAGTLPDIAIIPNPGELAQYASEGKLRPLDFLTPTERSAFNPAWLLPATKDGEQHIYTLPVKVSLKSIIWYNPTRLPKQPSPTWGQLESYNQPTTDPDGALWCMGIADGPNSGWPGTDMIEDIILHQLGQATYSRWAAGTLPWTSVKDAWIKLGEILANSRGGPHTVLLTDFTGVGRPMFDSPPGCLLEHQGSFVIGDYQHNPDGGPNGRRPGADFDFYAFPDKNYPNSSRADDNTEANRPWEVSADLAGMFNDTPDAHLFMQFLASDDAQKIWPSLQDSNAFTADKDLNSNIYHGQLRQHIGKILQSASTLCFDASDSMPATMRDAFYRAILEYLNDPAQLDSLLKDLDEIRKGIPQDRFDPHPCGS